MDPTELALLAGILADPADDTARLVYADFIQGDGRESRAEFIRVQIELANLDSVPGWVPTEDQILNGPVEQLQLLYRINNYDREKKRDELKAREKNLLATKEAEDIWPSAVSFFADKYTFRRGFLFSLTCSPDDFEKYSPSCTWWPGATMTCGRCEGDGMAHGSDRPFEWSADSDHGKCPVCLGAREVPRPCPPTAQPIEEVAFTSAPSFMFDEIVNLNGNRATVVKYKRFGDIKFRLPAESPMPIPRDGWLVEVTRRDLREIGYGDRPSARLAYVRQEGQAELSIRITVPAGAIPPLPDPGVELTGLSGHDRSGNRYTIPRAIVANLTLTHTNISSRLRAGEMFCDIRAQSVGRFEQVPPASS